MTADAAPFWFDRAIATPSETGNLDVAGTNIHYEAWGANDRPGVVLVHGSNAHLEWWRFVAPFLADSLRVVALDSSGNGQSGWRERYSGEVFAEEVMAVADAAIAHPRPFVAGHSFGGFIALQAGHRHGESLGGVVFVDFTVTAPEAHFEWGGRAAKEGKKPRRTRVYDSLEAALARFRLLPEQPVRHPAVMDWIARHSLRAVEGGWTWKFDPTLFDHLEMGRGQHDQFLAMPCRSAVMVGEESEDEGVLGLDHMAQATAGRLPIVSIPGVHHHMMFEEPLTLAMALKSILLCWQADELPT